jgi:hypothetical protein
MLGLGVGRGRERERVWFESAAVVICESGELVCQLACFTKHIVLALARVVK